MNPANLESQPLAAPPDVLCLEAVRAGYGQQTILDNLSLHVRAGEFLSVLGPRGCGKSTLLRVMAGTVPLLAGDMAIDGRSIVDVPSHARRIGMVSAGDTLSNDADVASHIGAALQHGGSPDADLAQRVTHALALVKLTGFERRMPSTLSPEQHHRVLLARALVRAPAVLLLDDALTALDTAARHAIQGDLCDAQHALGLTIVSATEDQGEAFHLSDRIAVMSDGKLCQIASPADLYLRPTNRFVASFLGDVNILPAHYHGEDAGYIHLRMGAGMVGIERERLVGGQHDGGRMAIYVRPEHLHFAPLDPNAILSGTVVNHVLHGDHVDSYLDVNTAIEGAQRLLIRTGGRDAIDRFPIGTVTALALQPDLMTVFPGAGHPSSSQ